jgi:uncharacterized protein involved in exopolysaccharide biosynthesis
METQELTRYLKVIRRWWWVIVLLVGSTMGTMLVILLSTETQFKSTATVQISAPPPQEVPLYSTSGRQALEDEIRQTQSSLSELILEGDVVYRVIESLPGVPMRGSELRQRTEVDIPELSHLMRISVKAPDAELAALLVETGLRQYAELAARPTAGMRSFIEQQLEVAQREYEVAQTELTEFQVTNKIGSLTTAINRQYDLIENLKTRRDMAEVDGDTARTQALDVKILQREAELQNLIGLSAEYYTLTGRVDRARDTYNFMLDKKAEAQIKENQILELGSIQVITPARPASKPAAALDTRIVALGAVTSLMAGVLLAFLLEYLAVSRVLPQPQLPASEPEQGIHADSSSLRKVLKETG